MKNFSVLSLGLVALMASAVTLNAEEAATKALKSGPQKGDSIGAFYVTKLCGAEEDGVKEGKNLCYRCRNGRKPQVMVFTRSTDPKVAELVQKLDAAVTKNEDAALRAFVNVMGEDKDDVTETAKKFAAKTGAKNIPFVIPNEFENGPDNYGINAKAEVTVVLASNMGVKANHAFASVKDMNVDAVIADLSKIIE
ncbi:hypothetical protein [Planctomycetes bacterium K23_9]|uniref:Thioredoxin domain-containing protein n=1 Tax=Stieleria marina TaxID=1930275 RepID=A0A517NMV9_9BACT|nr:hypothetical protein K239x_04070 [Planctomycetes bacterium K23_9]